MYRLSVERTISIYKAVDPLPPPWRRGTDRRQTDRQIDQNTDRQTNRQTRAKVTTTEQTDKQTNRQIEIQLNFIIELTLFRVPPPPSSPQSFHKDYQLK